MKSLKKKIISAVLAMTTIASVAIPASATTYTYSAEMSRGFENFAYVETAFRWKGIDYKKFSGNPTYSQKRSGLLVYYAGATDNRNKVAIPSMKRVYDVKTGVDVGATIAGIRLGYTKEIIDEAHLDCAGNFWVNWDV